MTKTEASPQAPIRPEVLASLASVLAYLWGDDELRDYEAQGRPDGHVWEELEVVRRWLEVVAYDQEKDS